MTVPVDEPGGHRQSGAVDHPIGVRREGSNRGDSAIVDPDVGKKLRAAAAIYNPASLQQDNHDENDASLSRPGFEPRSINEAFTALAAFNTSWTRDLKLSSRTCAVV